MSDVNQKLAVATIIGVEGIVLAKTLTRQVHQFSHPHVLNPPETHGVGQSPAYVSGGGQGYSTRVPVSGYNDQAPAAPVGNADPMDATISALNALSDKSGLSFRRNQEGYILADAGKLSAEDAAKLFAGSHDKLGLITDQQGKSYAQLLAADPMTPQELADFRRNAEAIGKAVKGAQPEVSQATTHAATATVPAAESPAVPLENAGSIDATITALNVSRHQSKLHFRRDEQGRITAGAHELSKRDADQLLASSHDKLKLIIDEHGNKLVQLTGAMTAQELEDFHRDSRALGKAVHGNETAKTDEYGKIHGADGNLANDLMTASAVKNALNDAAGQSHLRFAPAGDLLVADAGEIGRLFKSDPVFAHRLLGDDKTYGSVFQYNASDNTITVDPKIAPAEVIAKFQENARAIGRAHMGHFGGANDELVKIHGGAPDASVQGSAPLAATSDLSSTTTSTVDQSFNVVGTGAPLPGSDAIQYIHDHRAQVAASMPDVPLPPEKVDHLDLGALNPRLKTALEQVMLQSLHELDKATYTKNLGPQGVDGLFGKPLLHGGHGGYTGDAVKDYRREAGLPVSTDTTGDFDKRLIATYQKRKGLNVTEVVDEKTLEQIGNDVKNLRHEHGQNYISMDLTAATLPDKPLATPSTQPSAGHSTVPR